MTPRPIAITCGDPAGIGPEIAIKAWQTLRHEIPLVWLGDKRHLPVGIPKSDWTNPANDINTDRLAVHHIDFENVAQFGQPDLRNANGVIQSIETAVGWAKEGAVSGLCTSPISKQILQDGAEFTYPGHTEFLAALAGPDVRPVMMLASPDLRVVPLTIHIPIRDVAQIVTQALILETVEIIHADMGKRFGLSEPRICVAGLNPHASEGGKIGTEDIDIVGPAVEVLQSRGVKIWGPVSADTLFHEKARSEYDLALCMYHDQALIPLKTLDFSGGVNVTLGLPFIRTSPDHGTAFDIAGQDVADPTSMIAAIRMAWDMAHAD